MRNTPVIDAIMSDFAARTGRAGKSRGARRYLWTDAFAVCNDLELYRRTDHTRFLEDALQLVGQVHEVLGRHREDDVRPEWISGLSEAEGWRHPTRDGLRIGKALPERGPED